MAVEHTVVVAGCLYVEGGGGRRWTDLPQWHFDASSGCYGVRCRGVGAAQSSAASDIWMTNKVVGTGRLKRVEVVGGGMMEKREAVGEQWETRVDG